MLVHTTILLIETGGLHMKVVGFVGSPREGGNTEILVDEMLKGASDNGAETKLFNLNSLKITPCQACERCKVNGGECATKDDMQTLYKEIRESDAFVLGAPIYMWQMSAQAKLFTDRLYAFFMTGFEEKYGKKEIALAFTQGNPDENAFNDYLNSVKDMYGLFGNVRDPLVAGGTHEPGEIRSNEDVLKRAREIGKDLVS
jgi:multimeric flavodoxin WrbA